MMYEGEFIFSAHLEAFFHGEEWFKCPHCDFTFEASDAIFERDGIKKVVDLASLNKWKANQKQACATGAIYICPECGKKFSIV